MLVLVQDYLAKKAGKERPILLVISPLVSIIKDQIVEVEALGLSGCNLTETGNFEDLQNVRVIFSSAESAIDNKFLEYMKNKVEFSKRFIGCIVDESHTIGTWTGIR